MISHVQHSCVQNQGSCAQGHEVVEFSVIFIARYLAGCRSNMTL